MIKSLEKSNFLLLEKLNKIEGILDKSTEKTNKKVMKIKNNWLEFQNEMENLKENVVKKSKEVFLDNIKNEIKSKFVNLEKFVKECLEKKLSNRKRGRPRKKIIVENDLEKKNKKIKKIDKNKKNDKITKIENRVNSLNEIKEIKDENKKNLITFGNIKKNENTYNIGTNKNFEENSNNLEDSQKKKNKFFNGIDNIDYLEQEIMKLEPIEPKKSNITLKQKKKKKIFNGIDNLEQEIMKLEPQKSNITLKQKNSAMLLNGSEEGDNGKNDVIDPGEFSLSDHED